jgi:hypothetical protein
MIRCPECRNEITPNDFNVATDRAFCRACNRDHRYSELAATIWPDDDFDPNAPPPHVQVLDDGFQQTLVYKRISRMVLFFIPFTALWGGGSVGFLYVHPLLKGKPIDPGQALFGIPFLLGTIGLLSAIVYMLLGKLTIRLNGSDSWVFNGVGPIGRRKPFDATNVESVRMVDSGTRVNNQEMPCIELQFRERGAVRFGALMTPESKQYVASYLARQLIS